MQNEASGIGTIEHAFLHHGVRTEKLSEDNILKQRVLRDRFPAAELVSRAGSSGSTIRAPSVRSPPASRANRSLRTAPS